jgi:hypothetical protein
MKYPHISNILSVLVIIFYFVFNKSVFSQEKPKEEEKNMQMSLRTTSDHHFRGYNYSMLASQRNNTEYSSVNFTPSVQPQFTYSTPLKGLKTFFWGNFFLNNMNNRDNDMFILQDGPGQSEKFSPTANVSDYYPGKTRRYKENNGLSQYDGLFFGIYYEWETKYGRWSVGTWMWNNLNRLGKYSWQEYFIWYEPQVLRFLNPKFQFFLNTSFDNGGSQGTPLANTNGQNYMYYEMYHSFCQACAIQIVPKFQIGYVSNNDNQNKRSGFSNMIQSLKFVYNGFDLTFNAMYRPNPILYDTSDPNRSDSRLPNPSKQYGNIDRAIYQELSNNYPKEIANLMFYQYGSQSIPKMIFFISTGYSWEF